MSKPLKNLPKNQSNDYKEDKNLIFDTQTPDDDKLTHRHQNDTSKEIQKKVMKNDFTSNDWYSL